MRLTNLLLLACMLSGCQTTPTPMTPADASRPASVHTPGMVELALRQGASREEVMRAFGAPNFVTTDTSGRQTWAYEKHATSVSRSQSSQRAGAALGSVAKGLDPSQNQNGFGISEAQFGAVASGAVGFSQDTLERSDRSMTLIVRFGPDGRVESHQSLYTSF